MSGSVSSGIVARAAYPAIVVSSVVVADVLRARGVSPGLVVTVTFLLVLATVGLLERIAPRDRAWNPPWPEARQDGVYLALAALLQPVGRLLGHALAASAALASFAEEVVPALPLGVVGVAPALSLPAPLIPSNEGTRHAAAQLVSMVITTIEASLVTASSREGVVQRSFRSRSRVEWLLGGGLLDRASTAREPEIT